MKRGKNNTLLCIAVPKRPWHNADPVHRSPFMSRPPDLTSRRSSNEKYTGALIWPSLAAYAYTKRTRGNGGEDGVCYRKKRKEYRWGNQCEPAWGGSTCFCTQWVVHSHAHNESHKNPHGVLVRKSGPLWKQCSLAGRFNATDTQDNECEPRTPCAFRSDLNNNQTNAVGLMCCLKVNQLELYKYDRKHKYSYSMCFYFFYFQKVIRQKHISCSIETTTIITPNDFPFQSFSFLFFIGCVRLLVTLSSFLQRC